MNNSNEKKKYRDRLKKRLKVLYSNDMDKVKEAIKYFDDNNYEYFKLNDIKVRILKGGSYKFNRDRLKDCLKILKRKEYRNRLKKCLKVLYENDMTKVKKAMKYFDDGNYEDFKSYDIEVRILKGGSYKIKGYYLENNNLNDIRGASILLTYVQEVLIPKMIKDCYGDCIIYCGGGNILAILPENIEDKFNIKLEKEAQKYLVSGKIAYYISESVKISTILGNNYRTNMVSIENALDNRKKTKLYTNPCMESDMVRKGDISVKKINSKVVKELCMHCNLRIARYQFKDDKMCASCLHKYMAGIYTKNTVYSKEYEHYNHRKPKYVESLTDIDPNRIAVVYGDGNNMGGIIQNIDKITQMMEFSENVKSVANKSVFKAMGENDIEKFEVVGLGGDDVFVIVEAKKSIKFALSLIQKYNQEFKDLYLDSSSTMAVGIAIAKTGTPIRVMLEQAEEELSKAKKLCKGKALQGLKDTGALSFTIIDDYEGNNKNVVELNPYANNTLLPYETETAEKIINYVDKIKTSNISKSKIYNLSAGFKNAESIEEANLFFNYMNAKGEDYERIELPQLNDTNAKIDLNDAFYIKDGITSYIWDDIIDLLEYTDGREF